MNDIERNARRDFHLALPFGIIPGVGALVSFGLSRREVTGVWGRRLRWLAAIDLLVVLAVLSFAFFGAPQAPPAAAKAMGLFTIQPYKAKWEPWIVVELSLTLASLGFLALRARSRGVSMLPPALMLGVLIFASLVQQCTGWTIMKRMGGYSAFAWLASTLVFTASMLLAAALALRFAVRRGLVPAPHWDPPQPALVLRGLLYVISFGSRAGVLALAFFSATGLLRFLPALDPWGSVEQMPPLVAMTFALGAVAIAPAAEEMLFRGLFLPWLEHLFTPRTALLVSAAVFGLQHIVYGPGAAFIVVVGLVLGWARQRSGGLAAPLFIHTVNNALVTLLRLTR